MISFILIALLITIISVLTLVWPLIRPVESDSYERHAQNIHFARERLVELEQQRANDGITAADYEALKLEIETTLANDIDLAATPEEVQAGEALQSNSNGIVITLICCLVPFSAFVLYLLTGTPSAIENVAIQSSAAGNTSIAANSNAVEPPAEINELIAGLENRLKEQPDDAQGWAILARTYQQLGRYDEAIAAYQQLLNVDQGNANTYAELADAAALQAGGILAGQPFEYVQQALELNPEHPQALWLAGLTQAQAGDRVAAIAFWERLLPLLSEFPQQQAELRDVIAQTTLAAAEEDLNIAGSTETDTPSGVTTTSDTQETPAQQIEANALSITINVSLSESMAELVQPNDTVFVLARAKQGPPAPLAVKRLLASDLPASVTLSEADAMMPQLTIAQFEDLVLSARVAKSGNPIAQAGDLQSQLLDVRNDITAPVSLTIETLIK